MKAQGHAPEFADRIYRQVLGFGDYGFPESHSASFAQLAYFSAWIKHHHPAAFLAALLNSQPMGFYSPSQLIQDARRHGVEVRAADVAFSEWDCSMEDQAVRLGLRMVGGLAAAAGERIIASRPHASVAELAQRAGLNRKDLKCLAAAGALQALAGHRRNARWDASGIDRGTVLLPAETGARERPEFEPPTEGEEIVADYRSLGFTLGRHPLCLLRNLLEKLKIVKAGNLSLLSHGSRTRVAGLVTCRQRPDTASGVVFVTLEDESGSVNVVVWRDLLERQRRELLGARLLVVDGAIQREGLVVHLLARRLEDHSRLLGRLPAASRDFH
jgi:error-prone DNA polymerase